MDKYPHHILPRVDLGQRVQCGFVRRYQRSPSADRPTGKTVGARRRGYDKQNRHERIYYRSVEALSRRLALTSPCTIQGILNENGTFLFTDLNLRFGGGSVHTIAAGGNIPLMIYQEMAGQSFSEPSIQDQSVMTRYPKSIFHHS